MWGSAGCMMNKQQRTHSEIRNISPVEEPITQRDESKIGSIREW